MSSVETEVNPFQDSSSIGTVQDGGSPSPSTLAVGNGVVLTLGVDSLLIHDESLAKKKRQSFCGIPLSSQPQTTISLSYYDILWAAQTSTDLTIHYARYISKSVVRPAHSSYTLPKSAQATAPHFISQLLAHAYGSAIRQKRIKVLINPFGGKGHARQIFSREVEPLLSAARCEVDAVPTQYRGHALDIAEKLDTDAVDVVACCSGDGVAHEVFNGFGRRSDAGKALRKIAVAHLPCGSGNAMSANLNGTDSPSLATLAVIKGIRVPLDLVSVTQGDRRTLSFLSQSLGIVAEADLATEHLRWLGETRFYWGILSRLIGKTVWPCDIAVDVANEDKASMKSSWIEHQHANSGPISDKVIPKDLANNQSLNSMPTDTRKPKSSSDGDDGLPPLRFGRVTDPLPPNWHLVSYSNLGNFICGNMPRMTTSATFFSWALPNDGCFDLITVPGDISRTKVIQCMLAVDDGSLAERQEVAYRKIRGYRIVPRPGKSKRKDRSQSGQSNGDLEAAGESLLEDYGEGYIAIDGERIPFAPFQVEVHEGLGTVLSPSGRGYQAMKT